METTTDKTNGEAPKTLAEAAQMAADHAIDTGDPAPKKGREKLMCRLTAEELVVIGRKAIDLGKRLKRFDEETKRIVADRKSKRLELEGTVTSATDAFERGEEERTIDYVEYVSLRQNRRWRERQDLPPGAKGREYNEAALTDRDRQALLPNVEQGVLPLGETKPADDDAEAAPASGDGAEITDPAKVLEGGMSDAEPTDATLDNEPEDDDAEGGGLDLDEDSEDGDDDDGGEREEES